ncbi:MAG TPA: NAD(P)-binding domain-containing protein, partial [Gaiella sp.]
MARILVGITGGIAAYKACELVRLLVRAGHEVVIANSRGPDSLADVVGRLGDKASAATVADAARSADLVIEAIPYGRHSTLPTA